MATGTTSNQVLNNRTVLFSVILQAPVQNSSTPECRYYPFRKCYSVANISAYWLITVNYLV